MRARSPVEDGSLPAFRWRAADWAARLLSSGGVPVFRGVRPDRAAEDHDNEDRDGWKDEAALVSFGRGKHVDEPGAADCFASRKRNLLSAPRAA
jgi:hypothetical protein